jgi:hypothetical protein
MAEQTWEIEEKHLVGLRWRSLKATLADSRHMKEEKALLESQRWMRGRQKLSLW